LRLAIKGPLKTRSRLKFRVKGPFSSCGHLVCTPFSTHTKAGSAFKTNNRLFPALEFLVQLLQHLPDARTRRRRAPPRGLIRRYGLYSSRSRGTWSRTPYLVRLAPEGRCSGPPEGWIRQHEQHPAGRLDGTPESCPDQSVSAKVSRAAWARLLAKIYEVDALKCSRCGSPMKVLALITDPHEVRRILLHLIKTGLAPPGLEAASLS